MGSRSESENRSELKSDSKILGEKRSGGESGGDELQSFQKRLKMRDFKNLCRSDELCSEHRVHEIDEPRADKQREKVQDDECSKSNSDFGASNRPALELNSQDVSSLMRMRMMMMSGQQDPFLPYKNLKSLSSRDAMSECASSTGPLEETDPLKVWNEMKQNGFLSASHGGIPIPKQRCGRKAKTTEVLKKKMEIAKKEQVDRFTRIAAPSGLLNDLNPGIINHVRNRKQVHSIIKALVRSEMNENSQAGAKPTGLSEEEKQAETASWVRQSSEFSASLVRCPSITIAEDKNCEESEQVVLPIDERLALKTGASQSIVVQGEEGLALKLSSSSTKLPENEGSSESQLSIKAATVASQWLELLSQDVKGRLAALRRSKKRLRAVISTELPFLLSKEFPSDEENNPFAARNSASAFSHFAAAEMHRTRWNKLFDQMDETLSEEERQLESWLIQVKEMQMHCEHGLHQAQSNPLLGLGPSSDLRWGLHSDKAMALRASAASIYSTCNFILTHSNVSCF